MSLLLAGLTATVIAGAVVAVSAREARAALLALLVVLLASPLIADPLPGPLPFAARIAAAFLAARLIAIGIRDIDRPTAGSRVGWPVEALAAIAGAVVGVGTHGLGAPAMGPVAASAAGFAVGVLAAAPIVTSRDTFRLGIGAMLLLIGGLLVRTGLGGTPSDLEQLVTAGLIAGLGGAVAVIIRGARDATGDLAAIDEEAAAPGVSRHLGRTGPRPEPPLPSGGGAREPTADPQPPPRPSRAPRATRPGAARPARPGRPGGATRPAPPDATAGP